MHTGIAEAAEYARVRAARIKELLDNGVELEDAMRQVYHPSMSKEEYAAQGAKYEAAYDTQFGVKPSSKK